LPVKAIAISDSQAASLTRPGFTLHEHWDADSALPAASHKHRAKKWGPVAKAMRQEVEPAI
jgi:hypothetical protein